MRFLFLNKFGMTFRQTFADVLLFIFKLKEPFCTPVTQKTYYEGVIVIIACISILE